MMGLTFVHGAEHSRKHREGDAMPPQTFDLLDTIRHVELAGHQHCESLEVFHLRWPVSDMLAYSTLDEAIEAHWIDVTESTEAGQVSHIKINNHSEHMVFIMAGEQLVGCKQNRVLNSSVMVPPRTEMPLPVSCVERRRWGYSSSSFSSPHTSSHYALRAMVAAQALKSYRSAGVPISDQGKVWREVSRKLGVMGSHSSSDALEDMFRDYGVKLRELVEKLPAPTDCNGAAFVIAGTITGADFFDKPDTLRKLWPKLIRSCSIDALERPVQNPRSVAPKEISSWLESTGGASQEPFPSPGIGTDVRIEGKDVIGASLVIEDHPVHMELFRRTLPQQDPPREPVRQGPVRQEPRGQANIEPPTEETRGRLRRWFDRIFSRHL
jgi:ARG/rhodanese/phosphatase superfamily protein